MASSTRNPASAAEDSTFDDIFDEDDEGYDDEDLVITGVRKPAKRIVLTKRTYLLAAFIIVTILSIAATVYTFVFYLDEFDYPPTEMSHASVKDTLYALIALTVVTPVGFVILKFRITNLLIGVLYFFLLVLCLIFPAKGIAEAIYSFAIDTEDNIQQYASNPHIDYKLHNFWAAFQVKHVSIILGFTSFKVQANGGTFIVYGSLLIFSIFHVITDKIIKKCCGTKDIDQVEDWPYFLDTYDLPASCCTEKQQNYAKSLGLLLSTSEITSVSGKRFRPEINKDISYCGRGLARTRNRGVSNRSLHFKKVFSGFFVSLTKNQVNQMIVAFRLPQFSSSPQDYLADIFDVLKKKIVKRKTTEAFKKMWKNFYVDSVCNTQDALIQSTSPQQKLYCTERSVDSGNDIAYPADMDHTTPIETIGFISNYTEVLERCEKEGWDAWKKYRREDQKTITKDEYCNEKILKSKLKLNATTLGRELLLQLDYLTTYIYELAEPVKGAFPVSKNTWMLWPIPTQCEKSELYPCKLAANYLRSSEEGNMKHMYYFSRGISENFVLQSKIYEKNCELQESDGLPRVKSKIARDLNKRWRRAKPYSEWKNVEEGLGLFFLRQIHRILYVALSVSISCIFCVLVLGVVFWQYYSRIKAEEYANLALPKEFEVLHLRRGSLLDEEDIAKGATRKHAKRQHRATRTKIAPISPWAGQLSQAQQRRPFRMPQNAVHPGHFHQSTQLPSAGTGRGQVPSHTAPAASHYPPQGAPRHHTGL